MKEDTGDRSRWSRARSFLTSSVFGGFKKLGKVAQRFLSAFFRHPAIAGIVGVAVGGLIVAAFNQPGNSPRLSTTERAPRTCEPANEFEGYGDSSPESVPYKSTSQYQGQISQGDLMEVSADGENFKDTVSVKPGTRVTVAFYLDNATESYDVGEVRARVELPERKGNALELTLHASWDGVIGLDSTTDTATIFVRPSDSQACARYVPGSTFQRMGTGRKEPVGLDWITAKSGAYWGELEPMAIDEVLYVYFDVIVI